MYVLAWKAQFLYQCKACHCFQLMLLHRTYACEVNYVKYVHAKKRKFGHVQSAYVFKHTAECMSMPGNTILFILISVCMRRRLHIVCTCLDTPFASQVKSMCKCRSKAV